jgi:large subunit ribosomal protein L6
LLISSKMKRDLKRTINLPEGFTANYLDNKLVLNANGKKTEKKFILNRVNISIDNNSIIISAKPATRRESKIIGTVWAHINNMINGLKENFEYKLEICNVHFPMNVKVEGQKVVIKSFLGERTPRVANILPNVEVSIKGSLISVTSSDIEFAGQTAANIEKASRLTGRDRRIFQDGIFIIEKNRRKI